MPSDSRRLLLVASDGPRAHLRGLLADARWELVEASAIEQACFVQEVQPCDVVLLDEGLAIPGRGEALAWLAGQVLAPLVLIARSEVEVVLHALRHGATWIPSDLAQLHPDLLLGFLDQAHWRGRQRQQANATLAQLRTCHARVDRLLDLLWEAVPGDGPTRWFSQRHMLERLDEEVARTRRRGGTFSLILGKLHVDGTERLEAEYAQRLGGWMARQIGHHKRRCDVAGQYGLGGFMLLLPRASVHEALGACRRLGNVLTHEAHDGLPRAHASFGLAAVPADMPSVQVLLRRAEERLERTGGVPGGVVSD